MRDVDSVRTEPLIRRATPDDAEAIASVLNAVILEGEHTALTDPFTIEDERAFIEGLCDRGATGWNRHG